MPQGKSTRNRNSVALTSDGTNFVRYELKSKGWSQEEWASNGYTCLSTVRRLLAGNAIDLIGFKSLTAALQIEVPEIHMAQSPRLC